MIELFLIQPKWPSYKAHFQNTEKQRAFWTAVSKHLWDAKEETSLEKEHSEFSMTYHQRKRRRSSIPLYPTKDNASPTKVAWTFFTEPKENGTHFINDGDLMKNSTLV
jgi:hypothetical protein